MLKTHVSHWAKIGHHFLWHYLSLLSWVIPRGYSGNRHGGYSGDWHRPKKQTQRGYSDHRVVFDFEFMLIQGAMGDIVASAYGVNSGRLIERGPV